MTVACGRGLSTRMVCRASKGSPGVPRSPPSARPFSLARRQGAWRDALLRRMLPGRPRAARRGESHAGRVGRRLASDVLWALALAPLWLVIAKVAGLYDRDQRSLRHLTVDELPAIFIWALVGTAAVALVLASRRPATVARAGAAIRCGSPRQPSCFVLRGDCALPLAADHAAGAHARRRRRGAGARLPAGSSQLFPDMHVQRRRRAPDARTGGLARASRRSRAGSTASSSRSSPLDEALIAELVAFCRRAQIKLSVVPPARGMFGTAVELNHVADLPVIEYNTWDVSRSTLLLKRLIDVSSRGVALVALSPLFVADRARRS